MASTNQDVHESVSDSDLSSLNSTQSSCTSTTSRKKQIRHRFSSWTFQLTINTNAAALNGERASGSVTLQERHKYLLEHRKSKYNATHCYFRRSLLRFIRNILCPFGGYFHFHSVAWICPDQSPHKLWNFHHASLVPSFLVSSPGRFVKQPGIQRQRTAERRSEQHVGQTFRVWEPQPE